MKNGDRLNGKGHVYFFDGYMYPSVTTILNEVEEESDSLKRWRETFTHRDFASPDEYSRYSSIRGTFVHYAILNKISPIPLYAGDLPKLSTWYKWRDYIVEDVRHAKRLWNEIDIKIKPPMYIETPLCHHGLWYAGTPDLLAVVEYDGEEMVTVIDLKTSKRPYKSHYRQIGAYVQMINNWFSNKNNGFTVERGMLIYLSREMDEAKIEVIYEDRLDIERKSFNRQRDIFYAIPGIIEKYGIVVPAINS